MVVRGSDSGAWRLMVMLEHSNSRDERYQGRGGVVPDYPGF